MLFAFVCPPFAGHLNPMCALADALRQRGHRICFLALGDVVPRLHQAGFDAEAVGHDSHPAGALARIESRIAALRGLFGIGAVIRDVARMTDMLCRHAPSVLQRLGADAIVCDQLEAAGGLLAERLRLPQVSVANALMIDREPYVPPPFTDWRYARTDWARERNLSGYRVSDWLMREVGRVIAYWSRDWRLSARTRTEQCLAPVQISQLVREIDYPREQLPDGMLYAGPLRSAHDDERQGAERLDELDVATRLAFVSLGTLMGARFELLARITQACADAGLTAVVAHGGRLSDAQAAALPGQPIVRAFWPQQRVVARCAVVVTHGGLNTTLDATAAGVPLVLVPQAMEQGAIAQRVARAGTGLRLPSRKPSRRALRQAIEHVLNDTLLRQRCAAMALATQASGGALRAAERIERHAAA